jgi:hypothetical protein
MQLDLGVALYEIILGRDTGFVSFVSFEGQEGDSRVRLVVPTEQALRYFAEHAKVIQQAAK